IARNTMFESPVAEEDRSIMNIPFVYSEKYKDLDQDLFIEFTKARGMSGLKGHRLVGGFRASVYNALALESAEALAQAMRDFEKIHAK
ncbi:MAG: 3-phosphoserine/phosphohydroxythreonine transaminase, partial [Rikenellaceae bacterium]